MASFLVLKTVTTKNENDDSYTHMEGTVLSDFELSDFVKGKIAEGVAHYRSCFEPLTDDEAKRYRVKATTLEGERMDGSEPVEAPWEDFVGLHPDEVIQRLSTAETLTEVQQVKSYEKAGLNRLAIVEYVAPVERAPIQGYDEMSISEVLEKLVVLSPADVQHVLAYEGAHRKRPAIITFEPEAVAA